MSALREVFARFGIEMDTSALDRGNSRVDSMVGNLQRVGAAISANLVFQRAREFVVGIQQAGDAVADLTAVMGINAAELQEWRYAAQLAGIDATEFDGAFLRLQNRMAQGGAGAAVFRRLGVEIRNADGSLRNASDVLTDLADPISQIGSDTERTGVLVDLLGRSGARLGPLFTQGADGIGRVREEFQALGGGLSDQAVADSAALGDAWDRLDVVALTLRSRLAVFLLPALESVSSGLTNLFRNTSAYQAAIPVLLIALGQLAVASAATWGPMAIAAAEALFPLLLVGLAVEDIITLFRGGDSVIGRVMDALGGDGTQTEFVNAMREAWEGLALAFHDIQTMVSQTAEALGLGTTQTGQLTAGGDVRTSVRGLQRGRDGETIGISQRQDDVRSALAGDAAARERVRAGTRAPVTVNNAPIVNVDARGMDAGAAEIVVTRALARERERANQDTLDALAGGAVE